MTKKYLLILLFTAFYACSNMLYSQKNLTYNEPEASYRNALELFNKEKFNAAGEIFEKIIAAINDDQSEMRISSEYYAALCAIELFNKDAEYKLLKFIHTHPENPKAELANFQLAKLQYRQQQYADAVKSFETVDMYNLNADEQTEYYFKYAYSCFMQKNNDKAKKLFFEIIDIDTKYFPAANYYYANIAYSEKNYDTALKCFQKILNDENFKQIVPYYIAQIYYLQKKYDDVIRFAPALIDSTNTKKSDEIARIIGESYYKTGKYTEAIPYLEKYQIKTTNTISRQDYYQLGYAYYKSEKNYPKAIEMLEKAITNQDSLTQNIHYLLGDCYLKTGNKKFAMSAFQSAYKLTFYPDITEDALFNYAKLAYDLSLNPYNEAITSFQKFINIYPNSTHIDEAQACLVNLFLTTKNYKDALASIEKIKIRDYKLNLAYQKIAYYRGIELFNDKDINGAIQMFDKANTQPKDKFITVQCIYWKAEGYYRLSRFDSALTCYNTFLLLPGAFSQPMYNTAYYNIGYSYFKQKNYKSAITNFRKFVTNISNEDKKIINDAYLRIGDCYFISKEYADASEYYDKAIATKSFDTDYGMFQKSLCQSAQGKYDAQIATILNIFEQYPKTTYYDDCLYEMANAYLYKNDNNNALSYYNKLINEFPNSSYTQSAMLKIGIVYRNTDQDEQALQAFKKVVLTYPSTETSKDALESMLKIYMDMNNVDSFYVWVQNRGIIYGTQTEKDSVTYIASESRYMNGDCEKAISGFDNYIQTYPKGYFISNAYYYKAECERKNNQWDEALKGYIFVANQSQNKFSEIALLNAAEICYKLNRFDSAADFYSRIEKNADYKSNIIEARSMKMRAYCKTANYSKAIQAARELMNTDKVTNELITEAHITIARIAMILDSTALAQTEFEFTFRQSPNTEYSAEAKYNLAVIEYKLGDYTKSEKTVFEVINQTPSYDYWITKSFILLSDIYIKTGNVVQAKATLQSIIDNSDNTEMVKIAHEKLNAIILSEKVVEKESKPEDIQIKFDNNDKNNKLFEENIKPEENTKPEENNNKPADNINPDNNNKPTDNNKPKEDNKNE